VGSGSCAVDGWSIITNAATNSQLAGVLAGFVFSAIVILFVRSGSNNAQALGLFIAAFLVLAFDSYLFSLVVGGDADLRCARTWSEAMAASGMLAVGGVALLSGIPWLLSEHIDLGTWTSNTHRRNTRRLDRLSRLMVYGVIMSVALLLTSTTLDYFVIVLGREETPPILIWATWLMPLIVVGTTISVVVYRKLRGLDSKVSSANGSLPWIAAFGTLIYGLLAPVFAASLSSFPFPWERMTPTYAFVGALLTGLAIPSFLLITLALAVPPLPVPAHKRQQRRRPTTPHRLGRYVVPAPYARRQVLRRSRSGPTSR